MKNFYFVDFCGTLLKIQTYPAFTNFLLRELNPVRKIFFFVLIKARVLFRLKKGIELLALRYLSIDAWQKLCLNFSDDLIKELSVSVFNDIKNEAHLEPILLSGALADYIKPTLAKLNLDWQVKAVSMQIKGSRLTGFLSDDFIYGDKKRIVAEYLCDIEGVQISNCLAVGDSTFDIPLLESVNKAKIIDGADKILSEKAVLKGWDII